MANALHIFPLDAQHCAHGHAKHIEAINSRRKHLVCSRYITIHSLACLAFAVQVPLKMPSLATLVFLSDTITLSLPC